MAVPKLINTDISTNMGTDNPALATLADIIEPEFSTSFALAPIYWLLIIGILAVIAYSAWKTVQRQRYWLAKRQAIKQLDLLRATPNAANQINQLLKRVLQHYQPAHPALSASGEQWQHWLAKQCALPLPNLNLLLYQAASSPAALEQFYVFAKQWLHHYKAKADNHLIITTTPRPEQTEQQHA